MSIPSDVKWPLKVGDRFTNGGNEYLCGFISDEKTVSIGTKYGDTLCQYLSGLGQDALENIIILPSPTTEMISTDSLNKIRKECEYIIADKHSAYLMKFAKMVLSVIGDKPPPAVDPITGINVGDISSPVVNEVPVEHPVRRAWKRNGWLDTVELNDGKNWWRNVSLGIWEIRTSPIAKYDVEINGPDLAEARRLWDEGQKSPVKKYRKFCLQECEPGDKGAHLNAELRVWMRVVELPEVQS